VWKEGADGKRILDKLAWCPSTSDKSASAGLGVLAVDGTWMKTAYGGHLLVLAQLTVLYKYEYKIERKSNWFDKNKRSSEIESKSKSESESESERKNEHKP
jgi:uncharacterized membrane protein YhiD involved in acid resistance